MYKRQIPDSNYDEINNADVPMEHLEPQPGATKHPTNDTDSLSNDSTGSIGPVAKTSQMPILKRDASIAVIN